VSSDPDNSVRENRLLPDLGALFVELEPAMTLAECVVHRAQALDPAQTLIPASDSIHRCWSEVLGQVRRLQKMANFSQSTPVPELHRTLRALSPAAPSLLPERADLSALEWSQSLEPNHL
jgi:hypothetical protein